ncbi:glycosyltransferase family 2 protein [Echinimonas agarilytica]|uniref:Glycosyltransferase family 2 protein n=1 Tax=Echinimonas agarilytica TaxID=1215918 RepID=A0AA41W829_9GAMM|nr:glycosyltransferase family 2 protein [Echinimonas agarilytica]MCM2680121.1 glycosyltransferase family 2 protein [Echinimonas agarilytica]
MKESIVVVVINYKNYKDTINCVKSIYGDSGFSDDVKVIVVDNSPDWVPYEAIKKWGVTEFNAQGIPDSVYFSKQNNFENNPSRLKLFSLVKAKENLGFSAANNIALRKISNSGEDHIVWILNNDTVIEKGCVRRIFESQINWSTTLLGTKVVDLAEPHAIQSMGGTDRLSWSSFGAHNTAPATSDIQSVEGYIYGASMLLHSRVIENIGLMDERFFMWGEEVDWCLVAIKKGYKLACLSSVVVRHKKGGASNNNTVKSFLGRKSTRNELDRFIIRYYYDTRNYLLILKKHFPDKFFAGLSKRVVKLMSLLGGIVLYDSQKLLRFFILIKALKDGLLGNFGKTLDSTSFSINSNRVVVIEVNNYHLEIINQYSDFVSDKDTVVYTTEKNIQSDFPFRENVSVSKLSYLVCLYQVIFARDNIFYFNTLETPKAAIFALTALMMGREISFTMHNADAFSDIGKPVKFKKYLYRILLGRLFLCKAGNIFVLSERMRGWLSSRSVNTKFLAQKENIVSRSRSPKSNSVKFGVLGAFSQKKRNYEFILNLDKDKLISDKVEINLIGKCSGKEWEQFRSKIHAVGLDDFVNYNTSHIPFKAFFQSIADMDFLIGIYNLDGYGKYKTSATEHLGYMFSKRVITLEGEAYILHDFRNGYRTSRHLTLESLILQC